MTEESSFNYPFSSSSGANICEPDTCSTSPSQSPSVSPAYCGGSLVNNSSGCIPCNILSNNSNTSVFLGCPILGFNGKLGFNGSESSVTIDLATPGNISAAANCQEFVDDYGTTHNCAPVCSTSPSVSASPSSLGYTGSLGYIYSFNIGSFCFRGILSNHQYIESDNGYRYRVTLTDGRQILSNVSVILNDFYGVPPDDLQPNLINVLYNLENTVGNNTCGDENKCKDFGKSGKGHKGVFITRALQAINGKKCQLPITKACLTMDLSKVIQIAPEAYRVSSTESNVLELITLACEEAGYDFFVYIRDYSIIVQPINNKYKTAPDFNENAPLFKRLKDLADNNEVIDKEYGQEMTFAKSKKLVIGDNIKYLVAVEPSASPCIENDPGSIILEDYINADGPLSSCNPNPN
jgi:hypothetical protein